MDFKTHECVTCTMFHSKNENVDQNSRKNKWNDTFEKNSWSKRKWHCAQERVGLVEKECGMNVNEKLMNH